MQKEVETNKYFDMFPPLLPNYLMLYYYQLNYYLLFFKFVDCGVLSTGCSPNFI